MAKDKFEESLERLDEIVRKMESGDMSLEESLKAFEEGIKLARMCTKKLDEAERRVDMLLKQGDESIIKPFQEDHDKNES